MGGVGWQRVRTRPKPSYLTGSRGSDLQDREAFIPRKKGRSNSEIPLNISQHGVKNCFSLVSFAAEFQLLVSRPSCGFLVLTHDWSLVYAPGVELGRGKGDLDFSQSSVVTL